MRGVFIGVLLLWVSLAGIAQNKRIDSLLTLNNRHRFQDSLKAVYLKDIARAYSAAHDYAKTELYLDSAILVASKLPRKNPLTYIYNRAGALYHNIDRVRAINFYNKAIETSRLCGYGKMEAGSYLNLGALYMSIRDFPKSLEAHEEAIKKYLQIGDTVNLTSCYMNMSYIYNNMGQTVKGMEYIRKSLRAFEAEHADRGVAVAYQEMASQYFKATDQELLAMGIQPANRLREIAQALDRGLKRALTGDDISLTSFFYSSLGRLAEQQHDNVAAKKYYLQAVTLLNDKPEEENYPDNLISAGRFYANVLGDRGTGLSMLHKALAAAQRYNSTGSEEDALTALSMVHEKSGSYDSALYYFRKVIVVRDSIFSREKEQEITRRQLKLDFDRKERDYLTAQQLADARLKQQQQEILLRSQQLQISDKEKTLQRLTFLQKQAELQKQKDIQANLLQREQIESDYRERINDQQLSLKNVQLDSNRRLSVFLAGLAVIVTIAAVVIYNSRKKTVRLNKLVSEQKQSLEELVDVKDKMFSVVSHDMRGPVNNILALSSILEDEDIDQERLRLYVNQVKGTLNHTSSLMENLLNWSASQMKGFRPVLENVDISQVSEMTLASMEQSVTNKRLKAINHIMPGLYVHGDRNMIELIMRNLVSNAIKFSKPGDVLELYATRTGDEVVFSVKDNGVGMAESKVQHINSASVTSVASTSGTQREKGTGLGLMLCKHFASLMGGKITVNSEQGAGSRFHVTLPVGRKGEV